MTRHQPEPPADRPGDEQGDGDGNDRGDRRDGGGGARAEAGGAAGAPEGPARPARQGGRRVPIAVAVGVCLGAAVLGSLYPFRWIFIGVILLFLGIAVWELARALAGRGVLVPLPPLFAGVVAMVVGAWLAGPRGLVITFGLTALAVMVWRLSAGIHGYVRDMTAGVFVAAYVPFLAGFAVLMLVPADGADRVVTFIAVTIASDIGGFFAGSLLGRHRMTPAISPKKTWEGLAGSALACVVVGVAMLTLLLQGEWWHGVLLGVFATGSATFGDLVVSMIKRDLGIKDMGGLIPEHGGVMDRLDSLLATAPVTWLLLTLFLDGW